MSYCKYGSDSDVYLYSSTCYPDGAPCWVLQVATDEPETLHSREDVVARLRELQAQGVRVPAEAFARLAREMGANL